MKKNINFAFGFSIAELLITMLITMVVAAAMVPVIGLKKIKFPRNSFSHGIAECYYAPASAPDENGDYSEWQLMFYYADNGKRKNASAVTMSQPYCEFDVPKGDFFEIIAIGAGTDGVSMTPILTGSGIGGSSVQSGFIRVDKNYQSDISEAAVDNHGRKENVSQKIRSVLNKWASSDLRKADLFAEYLFDSPVGKGGDGKCVVEKKTNSSLNCNCIGANGESELCPGPLVKAGGYWTDLDANVAFGDTDSGMCWFYHHSGTVPNNSGKGMKTNRPVKLFLDGNTNILTYEDKNSAGIDVIDRDLNEYKLILKSSKDGFTPQYMHVTRSFTQNTDVTGKDAECEGPLLCNQVGTTIDSNMISIGMMHGEERNTSRDCRVLSGEPAKAGRIYYSNSRTSAGARDPKKLRWDYNAVSLTPTIGTSGSTGSEKTVVYENLKGKLYLVPAQYLAVPDEENITYVRQDLNDPKTTLVSASSASSVGSEQAAPFTIVNSDMPIPSGPFEMAYPHNTDRFTYVSKVNASRFNGGIRGCQDTGWCPGFAGSGVYIYIDDVPDSNSLSVTNLYNNTRFAIPTSQIIEEKALDVSNPMCYDGTTVPEDFVVVNYVNSNGNSDSFTAKYCKQPKVKGSPGAVIIIW